MWIIPKNYQPSSVFVLATVESKEDLSLQGLNIESSLMWRSKPSPLRTWSQRWSRVSWFRLLSTRILRPSHLISFETQLTSSLEDIRANRLAWQEERKHLTIPDTSSPTSSTMSEQLDLLSASSRMSKDTSIEDSNQSSKTWKAQVTIQRGEYSQRKKLAHLTKGNASSSWLTVSVEDAGRKGSAEAWQEYKQKGRTTQARLRNQVHEKKYPLLFPTPTATPYGNNQGGAAGRTGQVRHSLESMAKHDLWPTPTLHGNYNRKGASQNSGDGLETAVKKELWPTPTAMTGGTGVAPSHENGGHGWNTGAAVNDSLSDNPKKNWPTPTASDHKGSGPTNIRKDGKDRKKDRLDYAVEQKSGTLNPNWVEWLMGYPIGWTDLKD